MRHQNADFSDVKITYIGIQASHSGCTRATMGKRSGESKLTRHSIRNTPNPLPQITCDSSGVVGLCFISLRNDGTLSYVLGTLPTPQLQRSIIVPCPPRPTPSPAFPLVMPSYWRNFFTGQPSSSSVASQSTSHQRTNSAPQPVNVGYIYAPPGSAPSAASSVAPSLGARERSNSYLGSRTSTPSPLRYPTYDSASLRSRSQSGQSTTGQIQPSRAPSYRHTPYPVYTPSRSFSSSRSGSSSSIYPGSVASHPSAAPARTSSSGSVKTTEPRPILKQSHTWHAPSHASRAHVSFKDIPSSPEPSRQIHGLLAQSRIHSAPISYDVTYTPSTRTVIDRRTNIAVPTGTLSQPATQPPTTSRLVLRSEKLPWPIIVSPSHVSATARPKTAPRFYIAGGTSHSAKAAKPEMRQQPISNLDVLYALHTALATRITQEEWERLGHGSRAQRKITRAYEKRCVKMGGGWEGGVRRLDWLCGKTRLVGIELDKNVDGEGKLVFAKA